MTTEHRTRHTARPLTPNEIDAVLAAITAADSSRALLNAAVRAIFDPLLADHGASLADYDTDHRLDPASFAIPTVQWQAITTAITDRAQEWGTAVTLALDLVNVMPSSYDDPTVAAPVVARLDRRPNLHELHITREAVDTMAACEAHIRALGTHYGTDSPIYLDALTSWHRQLADLFGMNTGARTQISVDGRLSLYVATASQFVYAVIFHGQPRRCTTPGCTVLIGDDGTTRPPRSDAPVASHVHTPSYPLDAPQPGQWSAHS